MTENTICPFIFLSDREIVDRGLELDIDEFFKKRMDEHKGAQDAYERAKESFPDCKLYEKEPWTFLKLIVVGYYIDIYTNIAKNYFNRVAYFDFYAGPGVNYIKRLNLYVGGSPYIAKNRPKDAKKFDDLILFELDDIKAKSLQIIIPDAKVNCLDCNSIQSKRIIEKVMSKDQHYLAFIDPEGIEEIKWSTLQHLFQFNGDIIINYPYSAIAREHGKFYGKHIDSIKEKSGNLLTDFFGNTDWKGIGKSMKQGDQLLELFIKQIGNIFPTYEIIQLGQERGGFKFHLIIATKREHAPWFEGVRNVKQFISKTTLTELKRIADVHSGVQKCLTDYFQT